MTKERGPRPSTAPAPESPTQSEGLERLVEEAQKSVSPGLAESFVEYQRMRRAYDADVRKGKRLLAPAGQYQTTQ